MTMTALVATGRGAPTLSLRHVDVPAHSPGEVLVAVHAAAITFAELGWDATWQRDPVIPSHEMAGVVVAAGDEVDDLAVDDEIFGLVRFDRQGAAAQYVSVPAADLARRPARVGPVTAAAVPLAGLTAWQAIVDHARVVRGESVLVHGGAGGVGGFAVQLAVARGAHVTATSFGADVEHVHALGADRVIDIEREAFDGDDGRYDVVIDTVAGDTLRRSYAVLRRGGRLVTLAGPPDAEQASHYGIDARFFVVVPDRVALAALAQMVEEGRLDVPIAATYPLADGARAFADGARFDRPPGKTVLTVRD